MPIGMKKPVQKEDAKKASSFSNSEVNEDLKETDDLRESSLNEKGTSANKLLKFAPIVVIVVILIVFIKFILGSSGFNEAPNTTGDDNSVVSATESSGAVYDENGNVVSTNGVYDEDGNVIDPKAIDPGIKNSDDYDGDATDQTTAKVYNSADFIKDLNGVDVSAVYNVESRNYVYDYVNYEMRRATIDDGMEIYWVEALYNDKKYRIQIPFCTFIKLKDKGICKVQIEVLNLEGGGKIISFMQVVDDDAGTDD